MRQHPVPSLPRQPITTPNEQMMEPHTTCIQTPPSWDCPLAPISSFAAPVSQESMWPPLFSMKLILFSVNRFLKDSTQYKSQKTELHTQLQQELHHCMSRFFPSILQDLQKLASQSTITPSKLQVPFNFTLQQFAVSGTDGKCPVKLILCLRASLERAPGTQRLLFGMESWSRFSIPFPSGPDYTPLCTGCWHLDTRQCASVLARQALHWLSAPPAHSLALRLGLGADRAAGSTAVSTEGNHPDGGSPMLQIRSVHRHLEGGAH